ncbi:MAG: hypothetical protein SFU56_08535 [Capsulimonadales bacterium]|nr:hypothetical protein [Capsulimonadales bacterium]
MKLRKRASRWACPAALMTLVTLSAGCSRGGAPTLRLSDVVPLTAETLETLLVGEPDVPATRIAPTDMPLLRKDVYESVVIVADESGFSRLSRGALRPEDIADLRKRVVRQVGKRLETLGFTASEAVFPATVTAEKTLLATITPEIQVGRPEANGKGRPKELVLVRVTITDPRTGEILARRDYYSGADARVPDERRK